MYSPLHCRDTARARLSSRTASRRSREPLRKRDEVRVALIHGQRHGVVDLVDADRTLKLVGYAQRRLHRRIIESRGAGGCSTVARAAPPAKSGGGVA